MDIKNIKNVDENNFKYKKKYIHTIPKNEVFKDYMQNNALNFLNVSDEKKNDNTSKKVNEVNTVQNGFTDQLLELEKYSLGLKTLVSVKNKIISAYKEIMGMQM